MATDIILPREPTDISFVGDEFFVTGWVPPTNSLDYVDWYARCQAVAKADRSVRWWIGDLLNHGKQVYGEMYSQAEALFPFGYQDLANMKWVAGQVEISHRCENLTWAHHREVAKLDPDARDKLLAFAEQNSLNVRDLREAVREYKRNLYLEEKGVDIQTVDINVLPSGMYRIVYADPPWSYDNGVPEGTTRPTNYYPTMPTDEICGLPVGRLASDDAVLFLWSTSPHLPVAIQVIQDWGFDYKTSFVWDKVKHNMGHYNSVRHELLLVAVRGSCPPDVQRLHDSVIVEERNEHSEKPDVFRNIIDELYVHGRRLELFARRPVEGWDAWGNEI